MSTSPRAKDQEPYFEKCPIKGRLYELESKLLSRFIKGDIRSLDYS